MVKSSLILLMSLGSVTSQVTAAERQYYCSHRSDPFETRRVSIVGHHHDQVPSYGWIAAYDSAIQDERQEPSMYPWGLILNIDGGIAEVKPAVPTSNGPILHFDIGHQDQTCTFVAQPGNDRVKLHVNDNVTACFTDVEVMAGEYRPYGIRLHPYFVEGRAVYDQTPYAAGIAIEWYTTVSGSVNGQQLYRRHIESLSCRKVEPGSPVG